MSHSELSSTSNQIVGVVGAGTMGQGIAQLFSTAGCQVLLFDTDQNKTESALKEITRLIYRKVEKSAITEETAQQILERVVIIGDKALFKEASIVIEAVVEDLQIKLALFKQLEAIVGNQTVLATNTSSLSVNQIAAQCTVPERVMGLHFFNPVPLMKLVELIKPDHVAEKYVSYVSQLVTRTGHAVVEVNDTPGFLVNHAGRAFSTEGLKMLQERVADCATLDALIKESGGFPMGPFELLDLTGLDVSLPVMEQVYGSYYQEPRLRPSELAKRRLNAGLLGRKSGQGFYDYSADPGNTATDDNQNHDTGDSDPALTVCIAAEEKYQARLQDWCESMDILVSNDAELILVTPLGQDVSTLCAEKNLDPKKVIGIDVLFGLESHVTLATNPLTCPELASRLSIKIKAGGKNASVIRDSAGLVMQRLVAVIVNTACEMAQYGVASPDDIDKAVTIALGYPKGPFALGDSVGSNTMLTLSHNLYQTTGDPRYRPSIWLRQRGQLSMSLMQQDRNRQQD